MPGNLNSGSDGLQAPRASANGNEHSSHHGPMQEEDNPLASEAAHTQATAPPDHTVLSAAGDYPGELMDVDQPDQMFSSTGNSQLMAQLDIHSEDNDGRRESSPMDFPAINAGSEGRFRFSSTSDSMRLPGGIAPGPNAGAGIGDPGALLNSSQQIPERSIWASRVDVQDIITNFKSFLEDVLPIQVAKTREDQLSYFPLDCGKLREDERYTKLHSALVRYPADIIGLLDQIVTEAVHGNQPNTPQVRCRPFNCHAVARSVSKLDTHAIDCVVTLKGLVTRTSQVIPDMQEGFFRCKACNYETTVMIDRGTLEQPTKCPNKNCLASDLMEIIHNRCRFADKQVVRLQERPDQVDPGQTPSHLNLYLYDDLVNSVAPGDNVEVTGIYRATSIRVTPRTRLVKAVFRTHVDALHFKRTKGGLLGGRQMKLDQEDSAPDADDVEGQEEFELRALEEEAFKKIAQREDVYEYLTNCFAPGVFGHEDVKKGLLLQQFGGTTKKRGAAENEAASMASRKRRNDIHILMIGDPGVAKSQLMQCAHRVSPRGIYTSGKGSTAVGLTAAVVRDSDTGEFVLESGALVLSDRGLCCIDEFDKMSDMTRAVLHEAMAQQTVSIAKAGIIATLNARTSVLACANPRDSRFNRSQSIPQNIALPPSLISRFDLIYVLLDVVNEEHDQDLSSHILKTFELHDSGETRMSRQREILQDVRDVAAGPDALLSPELLTKYIAFAKHQTHPLISLQAKEALVGHYKRMRNAGRELSSTTSRGMTNEQAQHGYRGGGGAMSSSHVSATVRQLESMVRLAEARARLRLSNSVAVEDADEAARLIEAALQTSATNKRTGRIDVDLLYSGTTAERRQRLMNSRSSVLAALRGGVGGMSYQELEAKIGEKYQDGLDRTLTDLEENGSVVWNRQTMILTIA